MLSEMPLLEDGHRYVVIFLDNSESMHKTRVGDETLFALQMQQSNSLLKALKVSQDAHRIWVMVVTFDGVLDQGWKLLLEWGNIDGTKLSKAKCSPIHDRIGAIILHLETLRKAAVREGCNIDRFLMVTTDGLDGYEAVGQTHQVSGLLLEELADLVQGPGSKVTANVLAIETPGSKRVSEFFEKAGFRPGSILSADADQKALREAFATMTASSLRQLNGPQC